MTDLEQLEFDPRVFRRTRGAPDNDGSCVVYWMQRAQRATANSALNVAIEAGNMLRKPVVVFFQILPRSPRANLRHYEFMRQGLAELSGTLRKRNVAFVLGRYPEQSLLGFCSVVRPCLVIGDENPLREAERTRARVASKLAVPFWTGGCGRDRAHAPARQRALCRSNDSAEDPCTLAEIPQTVAQSERANAMARADAVSVAERAQCAREDSH